MTQRGAMGGPPVQPDGMSPSGARSPSSRPADWFAYVAFPSDCRCVAAVCVDEPDHAGDAAKFVADKIRRGFVLERMTGEDFRKVPWRCPLHPNGRWPEKRTRNPAQQTLAL